MAEDWADPNDVAALYDRHAQAWDARRHDVGAEACWQTNLCARVPAGGRVLDLGCGSGHPVGPRVQAAGHDYTGVDIAPAMIALARQRVPQGRFVQADMATVVLGTQFDIVLSWDGFFHLTPKAQRQGLCTALRHVAPGGHLFLTVGHMAGEVTGRVQGDLVYHAALSQTEYRSILTQQGARRVVFLPQVQELGGRTVLWAIKARAVCG
ncbi:MAG: class I SAM-dependent DNA methyltransferase [Paracoccaceae bacterium]